MAISQCLGWRADTGDLRGRRFAGWQTRAVGPLGLPVATGAPNGPDGSTSWSPAGPRRRGSRTTRWANILFVPIGALVIVVFRLTLGLRVLGPFRSVLLAFAFLATGAAVGLGFLVVTVVAPLLMRPLIKALRLPYFGRISIMLSAVSLVIVAGALAGSWLGYRRLEEVAYLPVVVVCLVGEALARCIRREGTPSGLWRAGMTALAAFSVALLASYQPLRDLLQRDPELVFIAVASIAVVARFLNFRILAGLNPKPRTAGQGADHDTDPLSAAGIDEEFEL